MQNFIYSHKYNKTKNQKLNNLRILNYFYKDFYPSFNHTCFSKYNRLKNYVKLLLHVLPLNWISINNFFELSVFSYFFLLLFCSKNVNGCWWLLLQLRAEVMICMYTTTLLLAKYGYKRFVYCCILVCLKHKL